MRIASTEGARVLEDSKNEAFKDIAENESVQVFKVWHTMGDEAVRESHEAMEGVRVRFDEPFILPSGVSAMYPKASGVVSEDINCRCYVEYVTEIGYNISKGEYDIGDEVGRFGTLTNSPKIDVDWKTSAFHSREKLEVREINTNDVDVWVKYGACIEQDKGNKFVFITREGTAVVRNDGKLITAWSEKDYDKNMTDIIKKLYEGERNV